MKIKYFSLISVLVLVFLFGIAATCSFCGMELNTAPSEDSNSKTDETDPEKDFSEETSKKQTEDKKTDNKEAEIIETDETPSNHNPVITTIAINEKVISEDDEVKVLTGDNLNFIVVASDEDNDELEYFAYDNIGNNLETLKLDNNHGGFGWVGPTDPAICELTIKVDDGQGGEDSTVIHITVSAGSTDTSETKNNPPEIIGGIMIENMPGSNYPTGSYYQVGKIHYRIYIYVIYKDEDVLTFGWAGGGPFGFTDPKINPTEWITPDVAGLY